MCQSIKIKDLIYKMVKLSGFRIKDNKNPDGDIEIKIIGLRTGEKLYEELLIGNNPQKTNHPKIQKISDPFIPFELLEPELKNLKNLLDNYRTKDVKALLERLIKSYETNSNIIDHIHNAQLVKNKFDKDLSSSKNFNNKIIKIK